MQYKATTINGESMQTANKEGAKAPEEKNLPNEIDLSLLAKLLKFSDRYEISIQFWPDQIAVYIMKDQVDLIDYGGSFEVAVSSAIKYLNRINKL